MAHLPLALSFSIRGFCFGAVFMATDPVTSARTERENGYFFNRCHGYCYPCAQSRISQGNDVGYFIDEYFAPLIDYFFCKQILVNA